VKHPFAHVIGWLLLSLAGLAGCARDAGPVRFHAQDNPRLLSEWNVVRIDDGRLALNDGVVPFDLNTPLFSDYAHKLRTLWMPKGQAARYHANASFDFPVGTILSKTFYYPRIAKDDDADAVARTYDHSRDHRGEGLDLRQVRMLETRLLVRRAHGWDALAYVWNADQTQAELARTGASIPLQLIADDGSREAITYQVPDQNQCAGCHASNNTTRAILPLGPKARHLNRDYAYAGGRGNQLAHLARVGYLQGVPTAVQAPRNADWRDTAGAGLDARARAYLDINCGHCHNASGPADTSGLLLDIDTPMGEQLGRCKAPVAAGQGTGDREFDIVPGKPDESILPYRMVSTNPAEMMPELGRATVHREGVELIREWIAAQTGACGSTTMASAP
jgi:uncharacterized repeat protein (TIGR03806 family)